MAVSSLKRGFGRLFLVLTIGWALFCTVVYPLMSELEGQKTAMAQHRKDYAMCSTPNGRFYGETADHCFDEMDRNYKNSMESFSFKHFWVFDYMLWKFLIPVVIVPPLIVFGLGRLIEWIWKGFKSPPLA